MSRYRVTAYCGGPNLTSTSCQTALEAREQADRWQRDMKEALDIVAYGPRKNAAGDYEIYRLRGGASRE
jgi:hypothetical protein